jgi:hypothetical protein
MAAGFIRNGYTYLCLNYRNYPAHRVAWLYMTGAWPLNEIDHINGDPSDNSFSNLREANRVQNVRNRPLHSRNTSGVAGVTWDSQTQKWRATITVHGKMRSLGRHASKDAAIAARHAAARAIFGEFMRTA